MERNFDHLDETGNRRPIELQSQVLCVDKIGVAHELLEILEPYLTELPIGAPHIAETARILLYTLLQREARLNNIDVIHISAFLYNEKRIQVWLDVTWKSVTTSGRQLFKQQIEFRWED